MMFTMFVRVSEGVNIIYMQETLKGSEEARFKEKPIPQALKALTQGATQTPEWNL